MKSLSAGFLLIIGICIGAGPKLVPTCSQSGYPTDSCNGCFAGITGTPPANWEFHASATDSCQGTGACAECCVVLEANVQNGCKVTIYNADTGEEESDITDPMQQDIEIRTACLETANTYTCGGAIGFWDCTPTAEQAEHRCFRLDCKKCK